MGSLPAVGPGYDAVESVAAPAGAEGAAAGSGNGVAEGLYLPYVSNYL